MLLGEEEALRDQVGTLAVNLADRTSLPRLGAVLTRLGLLVTNDSGPARLPYAFGVPTATSFGSYAPERYGDPRPSPIRMLAHPVPCRPCGLSECPIGYPCLIGVSVEAVVEAGLAVMHFDCHPLLDYNKINRACDCGIEPRS